MSPPHTHVQVVNTCDRMVSTGNSYTEACRSFSVSIKELSAHFKELEVVSVSRERERERERELLYQEIGGKCGYKLLTGMQLVSK